MKLISLVNCVVYLMVSFVRRRYVEREDGKMFLKSKALKFKFTSAWALLLTDRNM